MTEDSFEKLQPIIDRLEGRIDAFRTDLETQRLITEQAIQNEHQNRTELQQLRTDIQKYHHVLEKLEAKTVDATQITEIMDQTFNARIISGLKKLLMMSVASIFTLITAWLLNVFHIK